MNTSLTSVFSRLFRSGISRASWRGFLGVLILGVAPFFDEAHAEDGGGGEYSREEAIPYREEVGETSGYARGRCVLDLYSPSRHGQDGGRKFATVVWFHGGGLRGGGREVPRELEEKGIAVVAPDYRLFPKVKAPVYIEDAAAAVAWTLKNIGRYGGDADLVFVSGHSAGGYLASMVGLDKRWLEAHGLDADSLAGLVPFSGHAITHFTVREERGLKGEQPVIDDLAPLYHVRGSSPPLLLITGDRDLELLGRYEENAYLWRMMQVVKHPDCELFELDGSDHNQMVGPAFPLLTRFVERIVGESRGTEGDD